jgi:hypothetical protein
MAIIQVKESELHKYLSDEGMKKHLAYRRNKGKQFDNSDDPDTGKLAMYRWQERHDRYDDIPSNPEIDRIKSFEQRLEDGNVMMYNQ